MATRNRERFIALAEKRVTRTIKHMRLVGNLANRTNYVYEQQDVDQILGALNDELKLLRRRFEESVTDQDIEFKLR